MLCKNIVKGKAFARNLSENEVSVMDITEKI